MLIKLARVNAHMQHNLPVVRERKKGAMRYKSSPKIAKAVSPKTIFTGDD